MRWIAERVWQMGIGALLVLVGALLIYWSAAGEPVNSILMWAGLLLVAAGFLVPLLTRLLEFRQEATGEEGET